MGETTGELRQEIDATRGDAAQKIDEIERRITDTADQMKQQVTGLPDQVKEQASAVAEQVKEQFDWRRQVEERPLVAAGAAFLGGVMLASLLSGDDDDQQQGDRGYRDASYRSSGGGASYLYSPPQRQSSGGLMRTLRGMARDSGLETTISSMAGSLMANATDQIKQIAEQNFPGMAEKLESQGRGGEQRDRQQWDSGSSSRGAMTGSPSAPGNYPGAQTRPGV